MDDWSVVCQGISHLAHKKEIQRLQCSCDHSPEAFRQLSYQFFLEYKSDSTSKRCRSTSAVSGSKFWNKVLWSYLMVPGARVPSYVPDHIVPVSRVQGPMVPHPLSHNVMLRSRFHPIVPGPMVQPYCTGPLVQPFGPKWHFLVTYKRATISVKSAINSFTLKFVTKNEL